MKLGLIPINIILIYNDEKYFANCRASQLSFSLHDLPEQG